MEKVVLGDIVKARRGRELAVLEECQSTNDVVKSRVPTGKECVVISRRQTAGRGRLGRGFDSGEGGLYMSLSWIPRISLEQCLPVTVLAGLAVCTAVDSMCGTATMLKWPNDVYLKDRKICGILTEAVMSGGAFAIVIGIGVNLTNKLRGEVGKAGTILQLTGYAPEREALAGEIIRTLDLVFDELETCGPERLIREYAQRCVNIGREVTAVSGGEAVVGRALGVDGDGALLVDTGEGTIRVLSGEATLRSV